MKKILLGVAVGTSLSLLWSSCQKDHSSLGVTGGETNSNVQTSFSGVVLDNPKVVAAVPVIVSSDYVQRTQEALLNNQPISLFKGSTGTTGGSTGGRDRTAPTVSITSPTAGAIVSGTVAIKVNASDNVGVTSVSVSIDGTVLGTSTVAPYSFNWNTTGVASGTHTIAATAKDAAGNTKATSVQVGINAVPTGDLTAPSVSITSPSNGASFSIGASTNVTASASDNVGVSSVSFSVDGVVKSTATTAPYSYSWNTTGSASGLHTLTATAKDAAGNTTSSSITVTLNTVVIQPPTLPASVSLAAPPVINQGSEGSCVAIALGYYARSIEQYYKTGATSYSATSNIFSPEFLYNQTKAATGCSSGSSVINSLNFMKNTGICTWNSMPYTDQNGCTTLPTSAQTAEAGNYKITSYSMVVAQDPIAVKTMLFNKHALSFTFTADANFYGAGPGYIWKTSSTTTYGPHAITLVGYDDSKNAYKAVNQWGTTWGDAGYIWIDYNFLATIAYDLYAINP
ncbi:Ig-like domain-containing protein [Ferruginibacter sp. SUN002]|uniref:Ig-like domain-containing protein n=1 Tax=Ferruginibacter sp. SUN002 TaxID=2937789 RepID=UPI003D36ACF4